MASFFIEFGFLMWYLNRTTPRWRFLGGLVVRVEDCRASTQGLNPPCHSENVFFL